MGTLATNWNNETSAPMQAAAPRNFGRTIRTPLSGHSLSAPTAGSVQPGEIGLRIGLTDYTAPDTWNRLREREWRCSIPGNNL